MLKKVVALAIASALIAGPAAADPVEFSYSNHEMRSPAQLAALYERIEDRAEALCAEEWSNARSLQSRRMHKVCTADLIDDFVSEIDDSRLTALHEGAADKYAQYRE